MSQIENIVFWQTVPSPHQAPFIRALAERLGPGRVHCAFEYGLTDDRIKLGWSQPDFGRAESWIAPDADKVADLTAIDGVNTAHLFTGLVNSPWVRAAFRRLEHAASLRGLVTEGRNFRGGKGLLRRLHAIGRERRWERRIDVVFGMGRLGEHWFHLNGYTRDKVFPFCYVVTRGCRIEVDAASRPEVRLVFVGQLIERKNVALLLDALYRLRDRPFRFSIIGDGALRDRLMRRTRELRLEERVAFLGVQDNTDARRAMAEADALVLPSTYDGWGAVVNEALQMGTQVVVSDNCGAAELVRPGFNGAVFAQGSSASLADNLGPLLDLGPLTPQRRVDIATWARALEGEPVAAYLHRVLNHVRSGGTRPVAPWRSQPVRGFPLP